MFSDRRLRILQIAIAAAWVAAAWMGFAWFAKSGIPIRHLPAFLKQIIVAYGVWGPAVILGIYLLRSVLFFIPTTILAIVTGTLYGPVWGSLLNLLGENITANAAFALSRILGRRFVRTHERGWVKKYDDLLREEGFFAVLFMRSLYFPFDLVNYGSGMSGIIYRQYFFGSLLGLIPPIVTFTVLGDAFTHPKALATFVALLVATVGGVFLLHRSAWVTKRLYPEHVKEKI